jgi:hypothetical protein
MLYSFVLIVGRKKQEIYYKFANFSTSLSFSYQLPTLFGAVPCPPSRVFSYENKIELYVAKKDTREGCRYQCRDERDTTVNL